MTASPFSFLLSLALATTVWAQGTTTVRTVQPTLPAASSLYTIPGRTEPLEAARVFTRATGIVKERHFDIGDAVRQGEILAVIGVPDLDRAAEAAGAQVEQAMIRAANSQRESERSASLLASRVISEEDADQRAAEAAAAAAALRVAQAELARLEEQRGFATVRAPFDAIVVARNFDRGDRVRGDSATAEGWLYHLARIEVLRFIIFAGPDLALRLTPGMAARVQFNEYAGRSFVAKVVRTSRVFDPNSGTMRVELEIENKDLLLPSGLSGNATFEVPSVKGLFIVPTNTLVVRQGVNQLAIVKDGKVAWLAVGVSRNLGAQVEVTSPELTTDTAIIVNPNALLKAGDEVQVSRAASS